MFVGHGVLAFAIAVAVSRWWDWPRQRTLAVGLVAAAFATLPDVDMAYALVGLVGTPASAAAGFWDAAAVTHRSVTHSLLVAGAGGVVATFWRWGEASRPPAGRRLYPAHLLSVVAALALVGAVGFLSGPLDGAIAALFALGGVAVAHLARPLGPRVVLGAALLGLVSHPFGDLFTGTPPRLLYPLPLTVFDGRLAPFADPTLNLLVPLFLELGVLWLGLFALARLRGWRLRLGLRPAAGLGVGYAGAVLAVPAPTLQTPTPFVVGVLASGLVALPVAVRGPRPRHWRLVTTALAAVTVAAVAYLVAYLAVGG